MLPAESQLISVDDHIIEHPRVWLDRLPSSLHEVAPHVVDVDGGQQWCFERQVGGPTGLSAVAGKDPSERSMDPNSFEDMRLGFYEAKARLLDMDTEGVWAEVLFPNYAGFAGSRFFRATDKDLALLCVRAYNDFTQEEWAAVAPDRLVPLVITPFWDPKLAAAEVRRCAELGFKAISFPDNPAPLGLPSFHTDHWDPFFEAVSEVDMPLCMHFGTSGNAPHIGNDAPLAVTTTLMGSTLFASMTDLIFSPVFHKFPSIKVAYSEGQIGWIPFALQRLDQVWEHYRFYQMDRTINAERRPSDLFREHVWGCFIDDEVGVRMRHDIGVGKILWEADFPHADSIWPDSRKRAEEVLADVPDEEARQIVEYNARALFKI